ncbi:MAG TPA: sigma-54 dependent transcriptional regulator [Terracidiphilus sp.]|jgi:DNA-binding NtrC family response regulator
MQPVPVSLLHPVSRTHLRTALIASADSSFRQRVSEILTGLRWQVREAESGAQAWGEAEFNLPEAVIVDTWLPDLDLAEFLAEFKGRFPQVDLVTASGSAAEESPRGPYRQELLYALRRSQETDTAAWNTAPALSRHDAAQAGTGSQTEIDAGSWTGTGQTVEMLIAPEKDTGAIVDLSQSGQSQFSPSESSHTHSSPSRTPSVRMELVGEHKAAEHKSIDRLPELIGNAACMLEVSRRIRLVAQRMTPVLVEGPTGSGKELVVEALHRLSTRSRKPFVAINCAAIPEALLEAELFGHTRGAFTGAVQGRVGRIESADGGTLFLDEIGEMPLALQSKLLRFVESGELQRVGDNETVKVNARIVAATHRPLSEHAQTGAFRADLYYRLAVFLIRTPALAEHGEDLPLLVDHFLKKMGRDEPVKRIDQFAMVKLAAHGWPGNVRELEHVLERAAILAGEEPVLTAEEIDFGHSVN